MIEFGIRAPTVKKPAFEGVLRRIWIPLVELYARSKYESPLKSPI